MDTSRAVVDAGKANQADMRKCTVSERSGGHFCSLGLPGDCQVYFGASGKRALGGVLELPGGLLGASSALLGLLLGASWSLLGPQGRRAPDVRYNTLSGSLLGAVLGASWAVFGALWLSLSAPGESWSPLVSLCGCVGAILAAFWAVVERRQAEKAGTPKTFENYRKINVFCSLVPSWGPPGESLVGLRERLGSFLGRLGAVLGVLERPLGVSGPS